MNQHPRSRDRRAARRDILVDIRWGIRQALILTAICFVPATIAYLGASLRLIPASPTDPSFSSVAVLYASMAVVGGAILGMGRPALKTLAGTLVVGAATGSAAFTILLWSADWRPGGAPADRLIGAVLGGGVGALLAGYHWQRFGRHR